MRIKSALLALIAGAAIVAGACGSATEPVASGEARFPEGSYCAQALALGEDVQGTLLWKVCDSGKIVMATDPAYPPYSSLDASGEYVDQDVKEAIAGFVDDAKHRNIQVQLVGIDVAGAGGGGH